MLIIGERINSTKEKVKGAIGSRDAGFISGAARSQADAGADYIDVNCAVTLGSELQDMDWVLSVIQNEIPDANICIDSPSYLAIEAALKAYHSKGSLMINSISGDEARIRSILPLAIKYNTKLIALTMDEKGMPQTGNDRFEAARKIYERVKKEGFDVGNLYFDPLIRPIATEPDQAVEFLRSLPLIKGLAGAKTVCGLSNVSYGLPNRRLINASFLTMAIHAGLDAAILDPLDKYIVSSLRTSGALLGTDEYCGKYIGAYREGKLI
ncbi:MAG: dihydropteroate synthase [Candidatus Omnitrophica bacterium]|nr:dihydropteroate synthase [Candidatus Omnitrophota bacterium]MDD5437510.1 dihydropteroate synthase [Candidatus Omnitrophota bacterium]